MSVIPGQQAIKEVLKVSTLHDLLLAGLVSSNIGLWYKYLETRQNQRLLLKATIDAIGELRFEREISIEPKALDRMKELGSSRLMVGCGAPPTGGVAMS